MKLAHYLIFAILFATSCTTSLQTETSNVESDRFPALAKNMSIYEVNIRQYTPEGTFEAFNKHLPRLKEMGVDIVWLMPIQPIGEKNRKGSLGSYYSVKDYRGINPEFGTGEDFKNLVDSVHKLGMYVIVDWVPNHTAWDHPWITANRGFYEKDSLGDIMMAHDWTDVAQLNYDNMELREAMISDMRFFVEEYDIDGFRHDQAGYKIPLDFWQVATEELNQIKNLFWLAEWNTPSMHFAFHATYTWPFHHLSNAIAKGQAPASAIEKFLKQDIHTYGKYAFRMTFTSNHDENSWAGTVFERYGEGYKAMAVLKATIDGIPLIYGGQEAALNKRLRFFEKDTIDWSEIPLQGFYTTLLSLRKENKALWSGSFGGRSVKINADNDEHIYAYARSKDGNNVVVLLNLSGEGQQFSLESGFISGNQIEVFSGKSFEFNDEPIRLEPWEYQVFTFNN